MDKHSIVSVKLRYVFQLSFLERIQIKNLVLKPDSALLNWLNTALPTDRLLLAKVGPLVLGWLAVGTPFPDKSAVNMLYVHPLLRRKGIGTKLLSVSNKCIGPYPVVMWDSTSAHFYHKAIQCNLSPLAFLLKSPDKISILNAETSSQGISWFSNS